MAKREQIEQAITHLERAEAILAEVGAEWDLARAREALEEMG
jgi:hypothetical protein